MQRQKGEELKNVTLTLPARLLRRARHQAVNRGVSLSRYLAEVLEERVENDRDYRAAMERQRALMRKGLNLGTHGKITWTRDELHER